MYVFRKRILSRYTNTRMGSSCQSCHGADKDEHDNIDNIDIPFWESPNRNSSIGSGLTHYLGQPSAGQLLVTGADAEGSQQFLPWNRVSIGRNPV